MKFLNLCELEAWSESLLDAHVPGTFSDVGTIYIDWFTIAIQKARYSVRQVFRKEQVRILILMFLLFFFFVFFLLLFFFFFFFFFFFSLCL